ncbi:hypothetical protein AB0K49_15855 [Streptomyces decoyicus]|uniref:hypothetical protein n=1 Tax=Streptomyces decoyicus TaxID=249567 RepID=UPI00345DFCD7
MLIRLHRPWHARLAVALTVLVLTAGGVALVLRGEAPPPYAPLPSLTATHGNTLTQVVYESTLDRDGPPGPATLGGVAMLAVAGVLGVAGCLVGRRR